MSSSKQPFTPEFARAAIEAWRACREVVRQSGITEAAEVRTEGCQLILELDKFGINRVLTVDITDDLIEYAYPEGDC